MAAVALFVLVLSGPPAAPAAPKAAKKPAPERAVRTVPDWLLLGPVPAPLPLFHSEKPGSFGIEELLREEFFPFLAWRPEAGGVVPWPGGKTLRWSRQRTASAGLVRMVPPGRGPALAFLAVYVETGRFQPLELELLGSHPRRAWLDGVPVVRGGVGSEEEARGRVELPTGKHLLLVETLYDPDRGGEWTAGASFASGEGKPAPELDFGSDPIRDLDLRDILDLPRIGSVSVSPDGAEVALALSRVWPGTDDEERWIEVRSTRDGTLRWAWRGALEVGQVAFAPVGRRLSYVSREKKDGKELGTIWIADFERGTSEPAVERVENLAGYVWSPSGREIAYWVTLKPEPDPRGVKRLEGLLDRQASYRNKDVLYLVDLSNRTRRRLTAGSASVVSPVFSPDGSRLLFHREVEDLAARPYSRKEIWEIELGTFEARRLRDTRWLEEVRYAPDGRKLLVLAGPSEFGAAGVALPEGVIPNESEGEVYLFDPETGEAACLTREFDPSVVSMIPSRADGRIYLRAQNGDRVDLFALDLEDRHVRLLRTGIEVVDEVALAEASPVAVVTGTSPWTPESLVVLDLDGGTARVLVRPAEGELGPVRRGEVKPFDFVSSRGTRVPGRVYLPPRFDPARKYPAIVYYYGGTSPVPREFGGRYPKEWWAAQGYVVYVPEPSGATGFGQAHSAFHVNDWGEISSEEILEGTRRFLESHPFVDPQRVGAIGASFGGFLTMLLVTKSDLFRAAVSHAGISSIASYWGEGTWGYSYSAVATAGSFPWNRKDIYVDRSPLFRADRVRTPILLTHGTSDTNVPVGESESFFTALKLLGAPVEYLAIEGQDHWIVDHRKRSVWSQAIVAWFDRHLKGEPEWWEALFPERK